MSDDWVRDMGAEALIKEAHHTTHIEGTRLMRDQAERLWRGEAVPEADPDDSRELLNYRSAFEFVSDCLDSGDPITKGLIREIHRKLVEGVRGGKADPGIQNYVANSSTSEVIYTPPSAVEVPIIMSEMVKWLNPDLEIHPVLISGIPSGLTVRLAFRLLRKPLSLSKKSASLHRREDVHLFSTQVCMTFRTVP